MRWRGRRGSANVQDYRRRGGYGYGFGQAGRRVRLPVGRGAGVGGLGLVAVVVVVSLLLGVNPITLFEGIDSDGSSPPAAQMGQNDELAEFVSVVLADTEDTWNAVFAERGEDYPEPTLVLFSGAVGSACGTASSAVGPFYCGGDRKLYIDLDFFNRLNRRFSAPGDFAQAYVVAHEVGHHVQNVLGTLGRYAKARQGMTDGEANELSVRLELQADCFSGIWARDARQKGLLEEGDIEEALNAASQIGDDAIQRRERGYVVPDSFNHGTSEQRARWFRTGLEEGRIEACDTFSAERL